MLVVVCKVIFHSRRVTWQVPSSETVETSEKHWSLLDRSETNIIYLLQSFIKYLTLTCKKRTPSVHCYLLIKIRLVRKQKRFCRRLSSTSYVAICEQNTRRACAVINKRNRLKPFQRRQLQILRYSHGWKNRAVGISKQVCPCYTTPICLQTGLLFTSAFCSKPFHLTSKLMLSEHVRQFVSFFHTKWMNTTRLIFVRNVLKNSGHIFDHFRPWCIPRIQYALALNLFTVLKFRIISRP